MGSIVSPDTAEAFTTAPENTNSSITQYHEGIVKASTDLKGNWNDSGEIFHTVKPGSTLYSIAQLYKDVTLEDLYHWNPGVNPFNLTIGSQIRVKE